MHEIQLKNVFLNEALDNEKIKSVQILNEIFNIIDKKSDNIMDNNAVSFDNYLKMELNEKTNRNIMK